MPRANTIRRPLSALSHGPRVAADQLLVAAQLQARGRRPLELIDGAGVGGRERVLDDRRVQAGALQPQEAEDAL